MTKAEPSWSKLKTRSRAWWPQLREFLYGMFGYEFAHHAIAERAALESLFILVTLGDLIGVPVLPPYYSLRILPYVVPNVAAWKRRVLREKAPTDHEEFDLHGV